MNTSIPIRFGQITGNVTHCVDGITPPPLPYERRHDRSDVYQIKRIADKVAQRFGITLEFMRGSTRRQAVSWPRQIAMAIIYQTTASDLREVGKFFGLSHNAVFHARTSVKDRMDTEPETRALVESLIQELNA